MKKSIIVVISFIVLAGIGGAAYRYVKGNPFATPASQPTSIEPNVKIPGTEEVHTGDVGTGIALTGETAQTDIDILPQLNSGAITTGNINLIKTGDTGQNQVNKIFSGKATIPQAQVHIALPPSTEKKPFYKVKYDGKFYKNLEDIELKIYQTTDTAGSMMLAIPISKMMSLYKNETQEIDSNEMTIWPNITVEVWSGNVLLSKRENREGDASHGSSDATIKNIQQDFFYIYDPTYDFSNKVKIYVYGELFTAKDLENRINEDIQKGSARFLMEEFTFSKSIDGQSHTLGSKDNIQENTIYAESKVTKPVATLTYPAPANTVSVEVVRKNGSKSDTYTLTKFKEGDKTFTTNLQLNYNNIDIGTNEYTFNFYINNGTIKQAKTKVIAEYTECKLGDATIIYGQDCTISADKKSIARLLDRYVEDGPSTALLKHNNQRRLMNKPFMITMVGNKPELLLLANPRKQEGRSKIGGYNIMDVTTSDGNLIASKVPLFDINCYGDCSEPKIANISYIPGVSFTTTLGKLDTRTYLGGYMYDIAQQRQVVNYTKGGNIQINKNNNDRLATITYNNKTYTIYAITTLKEIYESKAEMTYHGIGYQITDNNGNVTKTGVLIEDKKVIETECYMGCSPTAVPASTININNTTKNIKMSIGTMSYSRNLDTLDSDLQKATIQ